MLFGFLNMLFTPVERLFQMVLEFADRGMAIQWVVDLSLALGAIVFVFLTKTDDIGAGQFGLAELTARSVVFMASLGLLLVTTSGILGKVFDISALKDAVGEVKVTFSSQYDAYLATFKHGLHSLLLVATSLLMAVRSDRVTLWTTTNATEAPMADGVPVSDSGVDTFLWVVFIVLLVSKFFSEGRHGEDAREMKTKQEVIGTTVELDSDHRFKHARGAALTVATGLLVFLVVNSPATVDRVTDGVTDVVAQGFFDILASKPIALSLAIYILVVALERIAGRAEWVYGGAGGLVVTGAVSTLNLIFAGWALAEDQDQPYEEIVVALGVIFLDAMRVGYGQAVPEVGVVSDSRKVFLRLSQAVIGLLLFRYITLTMDVSGVNAIRYLMRGVAAASALIKIVGISYIGKDLYKTSTEHHYRELASTGLLLSSAYLWFQEESTESMIYFTLALVSRFLDSIMDFLMTGKPALSYLTWDKDGEGVDSPTSDNPRTWLTLLGLLASLVFASMVMNDQFEDIRLGSNVTDASGAETSRPLDKVLSDSMIVAVTFIAIHVAVVIVGLVSEIPGAEAAAVGALSRSKFVRFAVTTTVLCSLAVAMGTFGSSQRTSSDGVGSHLVSALVSYLFADVVGRELL
jgi:hypothetical protein